MNDLQNNKKGNFGFGSNEHNQLGSSKSSLKLLNLTELIISPHSDNVGKQEIEQVEEEEITLERIAAGGYSSYVMGIIGSGNVGKVWCWGSGSDGQLGTRNFKDLSSPTVPPQLFEKKIQGIFPGLNNVFFTIDLTTSIFKLFPIYKRY